ncbi:MAG: endonuclease MutS2 [Clostridia bacterium]|nr:endonuclease MutS2 [Clostridia bacterium]
MSDIKLTSNTARSLEYGKILEILTTYAVSDMAKEMCKSLLPSDKIEDVYKWQYETDAARVMTAKRKSPGFSGVYYMTDIVARANVGSMLLPEELLRVSALLRNARFVNEYYENVRGSVIDYIFDEVTPNPYLEEKIDSSIISADKIADNASGELFAIRRRISAEELKIRESLNNLIRSKSFSQYLQEPIITVKNGRYAVPVKSEHRREIAGMVLESSASGSTVFIEPASVIEANNNIKVLLGKEKAEIERILYALSAEVSSFGDAIDKTSKALAKLDFIFAKAAYADEINAVMPVLKTEIGFDFKKARHPLIPKDKVVPTDIAIGKDCKMLVITGPNTGGKTVSMKTAGLLCLMLQSGLHIPAAEGSFASVFNNVYTDIGDEQSIEQSLSTFSAHMTNIVKILDVADENSLLFFDELGAGTDPVEGAALAVSILKYLLERNITTAASTHYPELKLFALETKGVVNASLEFDVETLRPTYRLITGMPGRSNAFAIASRLGIREDIIENSKKELSESSVKLESIIAKLDEKRKKLETELIEAERANIEAQKIKKQCETLRADIEQNADKEMKKALEKARKVADDVKYMSDKLIDELIEIKKQKDKEEFAARLEKARMSLKGKLDEIDNVATPDKEEIDDGYVLTRPLKVGDTVKIKGLDGIFTVKGLKDSKGLVTVLSGNILTKVAESRLRLTEQPKKEKKVMSASIKRDSGKGKMELDIRGMTVLEAEAEVDRFIDSAVAGNLNVVSIIHGKGTGALRKGVHEMLRSNPSVRTFRLGTFGEGEDGVTLVEIK